MPIEQKKVYLREKSGAEKLFAYGMRLRGVSLGCQPLEGLVLVDGKPPEKYHSILVYNRELSEKECRDYELDRLEGLSYVELEIPKPGR